MITALAVGYIHPLASLWAGVVGARTDNAIIGALFFNVGRPAGESGHYEDRGKQLRRYAYEMVGGGMEEIGVAEQLLLTPHHLLTTDGYRI